MSWVERRGYVWCLNSDCCVQVDLLQILVRNFVDILVTQVLLVRLLDPQRHRQDLVRRLGGHASRSSSWLDWMQLVSRLIASFPTVNLALSLPANFCRLDRLSLPF